MTIIKEALIKSGAHIAQNFFRQIVRKSCRNTDAPQGHFLWAYFKLFECNLTKKASKMSAKPAGRDLISGSLSNLVNNRNICSFKNLYNITVTGVSVNLLFVK